MTPDLLLDIVRYGYLVVVGTFLLVAVIAIFEYERYERACEEEWPDGDEWDRGHDVFVDRDMEDAA